LSDRVFEFVLAALCVWLLIGLCAALAWLVVMALSAA
jgi:hypothetical protein